MTLAPSTDAPDRRSDWPSASSVPSDPITSDAPEREGTSRVDMHCHSTASQVSKLGVQRAAGLPECATPPEEVYELARRRGMQFVTITDHDTIDGALSLAERPDEFPGVFVSEELTTNFRGEPEMAVHVLCYDITPADHEWLQGHAGDVELCAAYMYEREIACALAHPYYAVSSPLSTRHRRRLAELFGVWEVRNGARAPELNRPAAMYVATRGTIGIGGSDDHAGIDIGRTYTESPYVTTPQEFLAHIRAGRVSAGGKQGSAAKWAHSAIVLAARALQTNRSGNATTSTIGSTPAPSDRTGAGPETSANRSNTGAAPSPNPQRVMTMVRRLLREGAARESADNGAHGQDGRLGVGGVSPEDARCLLRAWLAAVQLDHLDTPGLIAHMQAEEFSHSELYRRACRLHERHLREAVQLAVGAANAPGAKDAPDVAAAAEGLFTGCIAAIPYAPASAFLADEQAKLARLPYAGSGGGYAGPGGGAGGDPPRVAILADGIGSTHGVSRAIEEIRARGVVGYEIEVVGTDPEVDRRLPAVAEIDVPYYPGLQIGIPSLPAAVDALAGRDGGSAYDAIHVCSPGPVGAAGALLARALGLPLIGSYHTELTAYAQLRSQRPELVGAMELAVSTLYKACDVVLSPSPASDETLVRMGVRQERIVRWDRGVDTGRFDPALRDPELFARLADDEGGDPCAVGAQADPECEFEQVSKREPKQVSKSESEQMTEREPEQVSKRESEQVYVMYSGRITREKGAELLAETVRRARESEPRLHLVLAGGGPEQEHVRGRVGAEHVTLLGWLEGSDLARAYASADVFVFASQTDTFGQVILEAQASGLPVVAVDEGGPRSLIEHRASGILCPPEAEALAAAVIELAGSQVLRERLSRAGLAAVRERTWERALQRLGEGYARALAPAMSATSATTGAGPASAAAYRATSAVADIARAA